MIISDIISEHTTSKNINDKQRFVKAFQELYRIPLFKPALDLILTKAKNERAVFDIQIMENWDRTAGHCESHDTPIYSVTGGIFRKNFSYKICIKKILPEIIMHEIAHAIEIESGLNLQTSGFYEALKKDLLRRPASSILANAIKQILQKELGLFDEKTSKVIKKFVKTETTLYKDKQIISELFARYYELLAISKESGWYDEYYPYDLEQVLGYFENTTNWIETVLNPKLIKAADDEVAGASTDLIRNMPPLEKPKFSEKIDHIFNKKPMRENAIGDKKWTGINESIEDWQKNFNKIPGFSSSKMIDFESANNLLGKNNKITKDETETGITQEGVILLGDESKK